MPPVRREGERISNVETSIKSEVKNKWPHRNEQIATRKIL